MLSRALNARKRKIFALFFALAASVGLSWAATVDPLAGQFSVADGKVVYFSKGNLQATTVDLGTNWTWTFAANQYDCVAANAERIKTALLKE